MALDVSAPALPLAKDALMTRLTLPDLLMDKKSPSLPSSRDSTPSLELPPKKSKPSSRAPIATGISTTIPVTGEKPRPEQGEHSQLEDDVLYAIFLILYEHDPVGQGMTVKQICDVLISQHPEMANLSTKTLNLVSAKLNAYVKRVEKGDTNLKYALLREWADASPKRMVYVYRGLLTSDFHLHVGSPASAIPSSASAKLVVKEELAESARLAALAKPRRQTMWDLGVTRHTFDTGDRSSFLVPYALAPVAAALTSTPATEAPAKPAVLAALESDGEDLFSDDDVLFDVDVYNKHGKRLKLMLYLLTKKPRPMSAAAAAPRAPRTPAQHLASAVAAAAALHAAAIKAILALTLAVALAAATTQAPRFRPRLLSQDIGAPEDTSLSDIDKFFA